MVQNVLEGALIETHFKVGGLTGSRVGRQCFDLESPGSQLRNEVQSFVGEIGDYASKRHATSTQFLIEAGETKMGRFENPGPDFSRLRQQACGNSVYPNPAGDGTNRRGE